MRDSNLDALVITYAPNVLYLSNHAGSAGLLVMTSAAVYLVADFRYTEAVRQLQQSPAACPELVLRDVPASYDESIVALLAELGANRVGFEAAHVPVARFDWLRRTIQGRQLPIELVPTERIVEGQRIVKDEW